MRSHSSSPSGQRRRFAHRKGGTLGCFVILFGIIIAFVSLVVTGKFLDKADGPFELYGSMCAGFVLVPVLFVSVPVAVVIVSSSKRQVRELLERGDDAAIKELFNLAFPPPLTGGNSYAHVAVRENMGLWNALFARLFEPDTKLEQATMAVRFLGNDWLERVIAALAKEKRCQRAREILVALEWQPNSDEEKELWDAAEKLSKDNERRNAAEKKREREEILKGPPRPKSGYTFHCAGCESMVRVTAPGQSVTCKSCKIHLRVPKHADCPECHSKETSFSNKQGVKLAAKFVFGIAGGIVTDDFACFYCQKCNHEWAYYLTTQAEANIAPKTFDFPCHECGGKLKIKKELAGKLIKCPKCKRSVRVPKTLT